MKRFSKPDVFLTEKLLFASAVFTALYLPLRGLSASGKNLADGLSIAGMVLLVVGLFRLVNRMGMFDSTKFGFRKFIEVIRTKDYVHSRSELPSLADYREKHPYQKKYLPFLAAAAIDLVVALLAA